MKTSRHLAADFKQVNLPETTSAKGYSRFVGGKSVRASRGDAWRDIKAWIVSLPPVGHAKHLPGVSEPFLAWNFSGDVEFQEREGKRAWITHRLRKGTFFLTSGGAPYECRWKALSAEPFHAMSVFIELPLLERALKEVFGDQPAHARLRDVSAFTDPALDFWMEQLRCELMRRKASSMLVQAIAEAVALHLARHYAEAVSKSKSGSPSLPGFKLRQVTDWMDENMAEEFSLQGLAARAGLSKFYFNRLFKSAMGVSPSRYQTTLRLDEARRLLRETKDSVVEIGLNVGYPNQSHFARIFRKETGLTPSEYRQQR